MVVLVCVYWCGSSGLVFLISLIGVCLSKCKLFRNFCWVFEFVLSVISEELILEECVKIFERVS